MVRSRNEGKTFQWYPDRRAFVRAELDAYYARLYGLSRDELRYILDPKDVMGEDYPSETFRVLKDKEIRQFGEYRTRRLVLEAWDRLRDLGSQPDFGIGSTPNRGHCGNADLFRNWRNSQRDDARLAGAITDLGPGSEFHHTSERDVGSNDASRARQSIAPPK